MCKVMEEMNKLAIKEEKRLDVQNMLKIGHDKAAFIMKALALRLSEEE